MKHKDLKRLAQLRLERGFTFKQLAHEIGVSETTMHRLLQGKDLASLREMTAYRIQRFLQESGEPPSGA